ncbi:DMT family transporter [Hathewaya histolytica]|uniref:Transporter n=1 Tax=Hathewaya histolytica TaxID=1498 RepID=A0A4U9RTS0_HATHI|nr:DMT family transporter [Hathewaya histolytica]VTQ94383.1 transporter [Hathewaya histolytica]
MESKSKGIIFMLMSAFLYALMNVFIKWGNDIPLFQRMFFTNIVTFIIAFTFAIKNGTTLLGEKKNQKFLFMRSVLGLGAMVTNFYAISKLMIADSSMLNKLSPFFVTIFAYIFLKEKLSKIQLPILALVFIGALLVIKPKFSMGMIPALSGFISAVLSGAAYTYLRFLGDKEDPSTIVVHFSLISMIGTLPGMFLNFKIPDTRMSFILICIGLCYGFAQVSMTLAYKYAPAAEVSIYNYINIIFASILGFCIFREVPDVYSIIGGVIIISAAIILYLYDKKCSSGILKEREV